MPRGAQHTHYNKVLSNISIEFQAPGLVAEKIFPRMRVENETDLYYEFDKSAFNIVNDERADGAPENESTGGWIERAYAVSAYGLKDKITKRMRANADKGLDLEVTITKRLTQQLANQLEYRILGASGVMRQTANVVGNVNGNLTGATASPRTVVTNAISAIQKASGMQPNVMVMNPDILRNITLTAEYREEFKFVQDIRNADLPTKLYGLDVIVAAGLANATSGTPNKKGAATSLEYIMNDDIWVGYVKPGGLGMRDITYGTLFYTEQYTRKWYDEDVEVDWIAVNDIYVPKLIAKECGYLITSPFTA